MLNPVKGPDLTRLRTALASNTRAQRPRPGHRAAAVAVVLAGYSGSLTLCLIERAIRAGDPWSGDIALPGGRFARHDEDLRNTAERETLEEISLELQDETFLGHVMTQDVGGAIGPGELELSAFAYHMLEPPALRPSHEVAAILWTPLADVWLPERQAVIEVVRGGTRVTHPATRVGGRLVWGLTRRVIAHLGDLAQCPLPRPQSSQPTATVKVSPRAPAQQDVTAFAGRAATLDHIAEKSSDAESS